MMGSRLLWIVGDELRVAFPAKFLRHKSGQPARRCGPGDDQSHGCDTDGTHGFYVPLILICFVFIPGFRSASIKTTSQASHSGQ
jgi:hypothetical protein